MSRITIISGSPGSGKSTLASALAQRSPDGVHLVTDDFYRFLAHRPDPSTPESKSQNTAVVRSFLSAARSFSDSGCDVFVDGVIGPWWRAEIITSVATCEYVILDANLQTVLDRVKARDEQQQASTSLALVREMHRQFSALGDMSHRTIDTSEKSVEVILDEFEQRLGRGDFAFP